jgi:hypothetical protein
LAVNEREATIVRSIFEMYASGTAGPYRIPRLLEERGIPTRKGKTLWRACQVRYMLKNHTYAGIRYFNTMTYVQEELGDHRAARRPRTIYRDRSEWIGVAVPAIVSPELFNAVQERLRQTERRYRHPLTHHLLGGLVQCGECGAGYSSYRRYVTKELVIRKRRVYHKAAYKCNWRTSQHMHARALIQRCHNPEIATHLLDEKVLEMIRYSLLDPVSLRACMDHARVADRMDYRDAQRQFRRIEKRIAAVECEKQRLIDRYASEQLSEEPYVDGNVSLDGELQRLKLKRSTLLHLSLNQEAVDESVRAFCDGAKARLPKCTDFETKRRFILDHVEKVVYERYKVIIYGSVPMKGSSHESTNQSGEARTLPFRVESQIDRTTLHSRPRQKFAEDGRLSRYMPPGVVLAEVAAPGNA